MAYTIGVDLGGSHTAAGAVTPEGKIVHLAERDLFSLEPSSVVDEIDRVVQLVLAAAGEKDCTGIGVGSPGNIDEKTGVINFSPNFNWVDVPLRELLERKLKHPLYLLNDARCATLGEYLYGSGKGTSEFALITIGTGIGGGFVSGSRLLLGEVMGAGEVGHHVIRPTDGFYCSCGKRGCFEAQASGTALLRHALAVAPSFPRSTLLTRKPQDKWGSKMIRKAVARGDEHALTAWRNWIDDLALGVSNIVAFTNPAVIALGGGVGQTDPAILAEPLRKKVDVLTTMIPKGVTSIVSAALGNEAGVIGAAALARLGGARQLQKPLNGVATPAARAKQ
jgi:glucokinase